MKIKKAQLITLICMIRNYWTADYFVGCKLDCELMQAKLKSIQMYEEKAFGSNEVSLRDFLMSVIGGFGLKPDATNEDIYKVLEVLGYEVTE